MCKCAEKYHHLTDFFVSKLIYYGVFRISYKPYLAVSVLLCQTYPVCVCLPVCLPVCLSAAEEVPIGSDSLLLAVLEEELW